MSGEHTAFFYGTLMVPDVFFTVIMGSFEVPDVIRNLYTFSPAILKNHIRHRVIGQDYPGVVSSSANHTVLGVHVTGLTDANVAKLDYFEGPEYERRKVSVSVLDKEGNEVKTTDTESYIFLNEEHLEKKEWSLEEFKRDKLRKWTRAGFVFEDCEVPASVQKTA